MPYMSVDVSVSGTFTDTRLFKQYVCLTPNRYIKRVTCCVEIITP